MEHQGADEKGGHAQGEGARPPPSWKGVGPPAFILLPVFFIFSKSYLRGFSGRAPHPRGQGVGPLALILSPVFFIYSKNILRGFSCHSENFYFCTKITPW